MYEEAVLDQHVLRILLVAGCRLVAVLPARERVENRCVDADVPIFENAVENVLTCADVLVGNHEARQPHRFTPFATAVPPPWRFRPPEEKGPFSSRRPAFWLAARGSDLSLEIDNRRAPRLPAERKACSTHGFF